MIFSSFLWNFLYLTKSTYEQKWEDFYIHIFAAKERFSFFYISSAKINFVLTPDRKPKSALNRKLELRHSDTFDLERYSFSLVFLLTWPGKSQFDKPLGHCVTSQGPLFFIPRKCVTWPKKIYFVKKASLRGCVTWRMLHSGKTHKRLQASRLR